MLRLGSPLRRLLPPLVGRRLPAAVRASAARPAARAARLMSTAASQEAGPPLNPVQFAAFAGVLLGGTALWTWTGGGMWWHASVADAHRLVEGSEDGRALLGGPLKRSALQAVEDGGVMHIAFQMSGPRGSAVCRAMARRVGDSWVLRYVALHPLPSESDDGAAVAGEDLTPVTLLASSPVARSVAVEAEITRVLQRPPPMEAGGDGSSVGEKTRSRVDTVRLAALGAVGIGVGIMAGYSLRYMGQAKGAEAWKATCETLAKHGDVQRLLGKQLQLPKRLPSDSTLTRRSADMRFRLRGELGGADVTAQALRSAEGGGWRLTAASMTVLDSGERVTLLRPAASRRQRRRYSKRRAVRAVLPEEE
eukprot:PLAT11796.1.p1 GENE.PLAT11796.1~~PLAT11796.1.p1  ORF type:complete len:364 (+),score=112.56 PLAT11796.1:26-1117(+)